MYLTKLTLNPRNTQAQQDLAVPYDLHRTLGHAFPDERSEQHRKRHGVLFRIEDPTRAGVPVLVQSTTEPNWSQLPSGYTLRLDGPKVFNPALTEGQVLRFRLVANPVRRIRLDGKKHPRRMPLVHPRAKEGVETGYLDWLERQASHHGFTVANDALVDAPFRLNRKRKLKQDPDEIEPIPKVKVGHFGVRFDGLLRVEDPDALLTAIRSGIGPAKTFGFGLLSLAPAR